MPMYEYACRACGHQFEKLAKTFDAAAPTCPKCESAETGRELSTFAVGADGGKSASMPVSGCGRCGGPNPCSMN
ncbi:MAG: putative regulatory protein FmdB family [Phycisphaerales bacterium]|nr:putative regulatory protein FmdB family [Phycisphaerales bacterium]